MSSLRLDGAVEVPLDLGFEQLSALPGQVEDLSRLVADREGGAVRFASLLERAAPHHAATHATLASSDGRFRASVPLQALGDAVIAYRDGTRPLPAKRGGPFRFFIPDGRDCATAEVDQCANVKFLATIRLTTGPEDDTRPKNPTEHARLHDRDSS